MRLLVLLLSFILALRSVDATDGAWRVYPSFVPPSQKVVDTGKRIYYLSGGNMFSFDLNASENISYTTDNYLCDKNISSIYYCYDRSVLAIAYESGNIDLLYDNGKVKNLPDILNAPLEPKSINDIEFSDNSMWVATDFGLVEYDLQKGEVRRSGRYDKKVNSVVSMGDYLVISLDNWLWCIKKDKAINKLDNFDKICSWTAPVEICSLSDSKLLVRRDDDKNYLLSVLELDLQNHSLLRFSNLNESLYYDRVSEFMQGKDGKVRYIKDYDLFEIDESGVERKVIKLLDALADNVIGTYDGENIWGLNADGLIGYSYDSDGWNMISNRFCPEATFTLDVSFILPGVDKSRIYLTNLGLTAYRNNGTSSEGITTRQTSTLIEDGRMSDVSCTDAVAVFPLVAENQAKLGSYPLAPTRLAEAPFDQSTYFIGTGNDGLYKVTSGKFQGSYNGENAPMSAPWGWRVYEVCFDKKGNMWIGADAPDGKSGIMVLPEDKCKLNPAEVKKTDWIEIDIPGYKSNKDIRILHCSKSDMVFIIDCNVSSSLVAYDTHGTLSDFSDDTHYVWTTFTDRDGNSFRATRNTALCEDESGKVWVGTTSGIFEITNPTKATDGNMRINRIKVPRNDGSGLADYLAGDDVIMDITVDNADRKWIATQNSGIYVTNESGSEIIYNFTPDNSPLKTKYVNAVYADPTSMSVYVGTDYGLMEYLDSASPVSNDYSGIYAYPNPVKPDYSGEVTITGLMSDTLVKITDAKGNIVWQGRSEGGDARWNLCSVGGQRVSAGVYYVFVSTSSGESSQGAVTKILVVN